MAKYTPSQTVVEAIKKYWKDKQMIDYCIKELSNECVLSNGHIVTFQKPRIKKSFCFGYSLSSTDSESYDTANELARNAKEDQIGFVRENIECSGIKIMYDKLLKAEKVYYNLNRYGMLDARNLYDQDDEYHFRYNYGEQSEMYKQYIQFELNDDDKKLIMSKLSEEIQKFVKRLNTYLKRYGLRCVDSWSYWQDA